MASESSVNQKILNVKMNQSQSFFLLAQLSPDYFIIGILLAPSSARQGRGYQESKDNVAKDNGGLL